MPKFRAARTLAVALALAGACVIAPAGSASAESTSFVDGPDASASLNDILRVGVNHGTDQVTVRIKFTDLRANSQGGPAGITIFIDTNRARNGPEFRLDSGLQSGTDYQLWRARNWRPVGQPKTCEHHLDLQFRKDRLVFTVARGCIGTPDEVRIGAKMTDFFDASHPVHDWMKGPRRFTSAVASG